MVFVISVIFFAWLIMPWWALWRFLDQRDNPQDYKNADR